MSKHISDPEIVDKYKLSHEYLDSMIRGEYAQIKSLNEKIERFVKYDFVEREVTGERRLVQFEDELMRIRMKDETINLTNIRIEKKQQEYDDKIIRAKEEC